MLGCREVRSTYTNPLKSSSSLVVRLAPSLSNHLIREWCVTRILLVEDERDVRLILAHVLIDAGYEVDTADGMTAGRERFKRGSHDLVLARQAPG